MNSGLVDQAVTAGTKAVVGVKDSITSNATNTVSKTKDPLLEMDLQMFGNKGTSAGSTGSNVEKASGAADDFAKETFLPDSYYKNNYSSMDGTPNSKMEFDRLGSSGNVEKSTVIYDQSGKQSIRIDYSDHGNSLHHTNPHIHEFEWNNGYKYPTSETKYFLDENGVLRPGRIDQATNSITFDFNK